MAAGTNTNFALGRVHNVFVTSQSQTFSTSHLPTKPASADAVKVLASSIEFKQNREDRLTSGSARSVTERVTGMKEVTWSLTTEVCPSGDAANTLPDVSDLLVAAMGSVADNASDHTYSLSGTALGDFLSIYRGEDDIWQEVICNAVVETFSASFRAGEKATFTFEGMASEHAHTGTDQLDGAMVSSTTATVDDGTLFNKGSLVSVGSNNNMQVTAVSGQGLTVDSAISASDNDSVVPYFPSATTNGSPLHGITGSFTYGGTSLPITAFDISIKNNFKPEEQYGSANYEDVIEGWLEVTGSISARVNTAWIDEIAKRKEFATVAIVATAGNAANNRFEFNIPYAEAEFSAIEVPESEEAVITIPFKALASSGADEVTLKHY